MMFPRLLAADAAFAPLCRIQGWALAHVMAVTPPAGDLRWTLAALAAGAVAALEAVIERQLVELARHIMERAMQGARFAGHDAAAATMVAAGPR